MKGDPFRRRPGTRLAVRIMSTTLTDGQKDYSLTMHILRGAPVDGEQQEATNHHLKA